MSGFDLQAEVKRADEQWKLAHGEQINAGAQVGTVPCTRGGNGNEIDQTAAPAPLTFADLQLGDEFYDLENDSGIYEKRTEKTAICWYFEDGHKCAVYDFLPTDRVRIR